MNNNLKSTLTNLKPPKKAKHLTKFLSICLIGALLAGCQNPTAKTEAPADAKAAGTTGPVYEIGITQIVEHPSLDEIRAGIEAGLKDQGFENGGNLKIDYENAQGSMENTQLIAQRFNTKDKQLVIAITTPSAQAAYQVIKETPVIFSAVTDPAGAGLNGKGMTGISDMTPIQKQLDLLKQLLPEAKTIGMVYNTGEQNSVVQVEMAEEMAKAMGLEVISTGISSTNDLATALDQVLGQSDVFYAHVDNSLASAFPLLVSKADAAGKPIIGAVEKYVTDGALATDGIDNYQIGYQTGLMAAKILNGTDINQLPIETLEKTELIISKKVADRYQIAIPEALKSALTD